MKRLIFIIFLCLSLCGCGYTYYGEEIKSTPIDVEFVEAHYEEGEYYRYVIPNHMMVPVKTKKYIPNEYYVIYEREFSSGKIINAKVLVTKEIYDKIKKELEDND